ncbi:MAG: hypothetical protein SGJ20_11685 [Planctomycetota bacterium]|nr:hypothetical protein [Planctomycetota bacterium]
MLRMGNRGGEKRRRVLAEERAAEGAAAPSTARQSRTSRGGETYTDAARRNHQPRLTDLVPRGNWTFCFIGIAGVSLIALLLFAHHATQPVEWFRSVRTFDLQSPSSLAGWFSSATLMLSAMLSFLIYRLRRCRLDDYRGRYRVWLWTSIGLAIASVNSIAGLHLAIQHAMVHWTEQTVVGNGEIWWLGPVGLLTVSLAIRLALDVRVSRLAITCLTLGTLFWTTALVMQLMSAVDQYPELVLVQAGLRLTGQSTLLFGFLGYARYVVLDANGELPVRVSRAKREKKARTDADDSDNSEEEATPKAAGTSSRVDSAHASNSSASNSSTGKTSDGVGSFSANNSSTVPTRSKPIFGNAASTQSRSEPDDDDESDDDVRGGKLSRAERKKLRRQQREG